MKRIVFSILAFCAVAFSLNAQITAQTKAVLASIEKANESLKTITSPVTETRTLPNGKAFVSKGNFHFASPDCLAILYTNPQGEYLVINTEEIAQKKKQGKTFKLSLKKNETMKELSSTLLWCISGKLIRLAEANNASVKVSEANGVINVVFTAEVKTGRDFKKIELKYEKATLRLKSMAMTDKNNIVTKYTMDKPQYGTSIPASVFIVK
jgi:outer membrane lipoprotein-sorting protein